MYPLECDRYTNTKPNDPLRKTIRYEKRSVAKNDPLPKKTIRYLIVPLPNFEVVLLGQLALLPQLSVVRVERLLQRRRVPTRPDPPRNGRHRSARVRPVPPGRHDRLAAGFHRHGPSRR